MVGWQGETEWTAWRWEHPRLDPDEEINDDSET